MFALSDAITINKLFVDGDQLVETIRNESESCPASVQSEMRQRFFAIRNEWNAFKSTAHRPALLSGSESFRSNLPATTSAVLNQGIESLERTADSLHRTELVARESEEIGTTIIDELTGQQETLLRTRGRLDGVNVNLKRSHRLIKILNLTVVTNKCLLILIIGLEIMILLAIVYLRFIRH